MWKRILESDTPCGSMDQNYMNRPLSELTVGELLDLIQSAVSISTLPRRTVHGLQGLADLLGVSISQAKRVVKSGQIDGAVARNGRKIVVDADKALRLWSGKRNF